MRNRIATIIGLLWLCASALAQPFSIGDPGFIFQGAAVGAPAGDDCSVTNLLFSWHMEDLDVTAGTPGGCSDGDTTGTLVSGAVISSTQAQDGTYSLSIPTASDYCTFTISGDDIANDVTGTVKIYVYITAFVNNADFLNIRYDSTNRIRISMNGTDDATGREVRIYHYGNNSTAISVWTTACDMALNQWYLITAKWASTGNPNLYIDVDGAGGVTGNTDLGAMANSPNVLEIGNNNALNGYFFIDNIKIYDNWQP